MIDKISFDNFVFAEVVKDRGITKVQYLERDPDDSIQTEQFPKSISLQKLIKTARWELPGDLNTQKFNSPFNKKEYEFYIDRDSGENEKGNVREVLKKIAQEIEYIQSTCYNYTRTEYPALFTMWILDTYFCNFFDYAPRIKIVGDSSSGKTRIFKLARYLGYRVKNTVNVTGPAVFRGVEMFHTSYATDESQDLDKETRNFFNLLWKAGAEKDGGYVERCDQDGVPESFCVYSPMIKGVMNGTRDKNDVENRAFTVRTRRITNRKIERIPMDRISELRTALYRIKIYNERWNYALDLEEMIIKAEEELTCIECTKEEIDRAEREYPYLYEIKKKLGNLDGRPLDMAIVYYALAKITGFEKEILTLCYEMKDKLSETDKESQNGKIFRALFDVAVHLLDDEGRYISETTLELRYMSPKERLNMISTRDIKERYNTIARKEGEYEIETGQVTSTFGGWGFGIRKGKNGTKFLENNGQFQDLIRVYSDMYLDDDLDVLELR